MSEVAESPQAVEPEADLPGTDVSVAEIKERGAITEHALTVMPIMDAAELQRTWRVATALAQSGMFKDANTEAQAFAKILIGRDMGISATQALLTIDLVKGNIQLRGVLLAAFVQRHPNYHYKLLENTHEKAVVQFLGYPQDESEEGFVKSQGKWWEPIGQEEFTTADAERAGLMKADSNWKKYPKNMCVWRCISNGVKFYMPELFGGMPVYVEGELPPQLGSGSGSAHSAAAAPEERAPEADLPEGLAGLVERAAAIDSVKWRKAEILARLPEADDEGYEAAATTIKDELEAFLAEHEPEDADVVPEEPPPVEPNILAGLQKRWDEDEEWREQVKPALSAYIDAEQAVSAAMEADDIEAAGNAGEALEKAESALTELDVPAGWMPADPSA